jgi:hypothetical protein
MPGYATAAEAFSAAVLSKTAGIEPWFDLSLKALRGFPEFGYQQRGPAQMGRPIGIFRPLGEPCRFEP